MSFTNRVLAVDDNPTNLMIVEELLQGRYDLHLATDGEEALFLARRLIPDVVLLDINMPRPNGFEVCSQLRNDRVLEHSRVIMVSAMTDIDDRLRAFYAGADDFVTKPFDERELLAKIEASMQSRRQYCKVEQDLNDLCSAAGQTLELVTHLRDTETGEHIDRIRDLTLLIATQMRDGPLASAIDDQFLDDLYHGSALHDVGKIAIADAILHKPGPLTDVEFAQMKRHTIFGEQMLNQLAKDSPNSYFTNAARIARSHHERYDGKGYPDGLAGEEIPLAARIVKVADVFDALVSERVYKKCYEPTYAKQVIVEGSGVSFDPHVVDAMVKVFDEVLEMYAGESMLC
jgi:putative two-component system response regulator